MNTSWPASKAATLCRYMQRLGYPVTRFGRMIISPLSEPVYLSVECLNSGEIVIEGGRRYVGPLTGMAMRTWYADEPLVLNGFQLLPVEIVEKIATYLVGKGLANSV